METVMVAGILGLVATIINYETISRKASEKLFGRRRRDWCKCLEIPFLLGPIIYLMIFPTNIYAIFATLIGNRQYFKAPRAISMSKSA